MCVRLAVGVILLFATGAELRPRRACADQEAPPVAPEASAANDAESRKKRLAERDRVWDEAQELLAKGDLAAAEDRARAVLAIEQEVLGDADSELISTLEVIAQCQEARQAWQEATATRQEIIQRAVTAFGETDYRVVDARIDAQHLVRLQQLTAEQRRELAEADSLHKKLIALHEEGHYAEAIELGERVLDARRRILGDRHRDTANSLYLLALLKLALGDYARAQSLFDEALAIQKETLGELHPDYALTLNNLAYLYQAKDNYTRAESLYRQALAIRKELLGESHPDYAASLHNLASLLQAKGDFAQAEPLQVHVCQILKDALGEDNPRYAASVTNLAYLYKAQGDFARAEPLFRKSLQINKNAIGEHHPEYAISLNNLAMLYQSLGDYAQAETLAQQVSQILKESFGQQHPDYATSLNNLAGLYQDQGDYARAEPLYQQALEIRRIALTEKHRDFAASLNNVARLLDDQGDYARAELLYRQALEIWKDALGEGHPDYARGLNNLANLYVAQSDYARAEPLFQEALEIWKSGLPATQLGYATVLHSLVMLYQSQADYAKAESLQREAMDILKGVQGEEHPDHATGLHNLAAIYQAQGDYARAEELFRQSMEIRKHALGEQHPAYATSLYNRAILLADLERAAEGVPLALAALAIESDALESSAAVQSERQQLIMASNLAGHASSLLSLGKLSSASGDDLYAALLPLKGRVLIRQRAMRQIRRELAQHPDSPATQALLALADRTRELDRLSKFTPSPGELDSHRQRLGELTLQIESLQKTLAAKNAEFRKSQVQAQLTPSELAARLPADTALVDMRGYNQYLPHDAQHAIGRWDKQYAAFVLRPGKPASVVWLGAADPIHAAIDEWRKQLDGRPGDEAGQTLRRLLWEPIEPVLGDATTVLTSPDVALHKIPWSALPGRTPGSYLIEERTFATIAAPLLLPELLDRAEQGEATPVLLAIGDVDYGSDAGVIELAANARSYSAARNGDDLWNWAPLANTRVEVVSIDDTFRRAFRGASSFSLREAEATEQAFRGAAPQATFLHLATHGYFAPEKLLSIFSATRADERGLGLYMKDDVSGWHPGLLSGIVLAGANLPAAADHDDGVLTALEVSELDLSGVELVTLSACETGLGRTAGGEGVLGLQRAFQLAGARSTVASLWKVPDDATRALMIEFYENLWRKKMSRAEALRQAQLTMLREGVKRGATPDDDHPADGNRLPPYYWAAFVLGGEWR